MVQIIDIECFHGFNDTLVIKELAVQIVSDNNIFTKTFQAPFDWKDLPLNVRRSNAWIHHKLNKLQWSEGDLPFSELKSVLLSVVDPNLTIFTKGLQKCQLLSSLLDRSVYNLEELQCPKAKDLGKCNQPCPNSRDYLEHGTTINCAVKKCRLFTEWVRGNSDKLTEWKICNGVNV